MTPLEIVARLLDSIDRGEWELLPALYAVDAVVELPFAHPKMRLDGREAIRAHFASASRAPFRMRVADRVLHSVVDPELIVAEYRYEIVATATGRVGTVDNVQIIRVRNGEIVNSRDFHDHASIAAVLRPER